MTNSPPEHVAIIMDGNGRWAKKRSLTRLSGHKQGAEVLKNIVNYAPELGIRYLTVYAFSSENWGRPAPEVRGLISLLEHYLDQEEENFLKGHIRLRVIGDRERFPPSLQQRIDRVERLSIHHTGLFLQVAFGYGSRQEIVRATKTMAEDIQKGILLAKDITEDVLSRYLYTAEIPDPDLLIRTGGEQRISNYLLWQLAYAELLFLDKHWPDFTIEDFARAVDIYAKRERRFGYAA